MNTRKLLSIPFLAILSVAGLLGSAAHADDGYPDKPINMVVPFPPGGYADNIARVLAPALEKTISTPVVIVNRPGAGGAIGTAQVARAKADGYTVLFSLSGISTLPAQAKINNSKPLFAFSELQPVGRVTADPLAIIVKSDSKYKNLNDLLADARANPGLLTYASSGNYGTVHVPLEMFAHEAKISVRHIPYSGGNPIMVALLGGQVDFSMLPQTSIASFVDSGKIRMLATVGSSRWAQYPDTATTAESGLHFEYVSWTGLFVPASTPAPIQEKLSAGLRAAVDDAQLKDRLSQINSHLAYMPPEEFAGFWKKEIDELTQVVERIGKLE